MKKFILIDHEPFTKRRKELFYIEELINRGIDVEVWDISQYCFPTITIADTLQNEVYVTKISTLKELEVKLQSTPVFRSVFFLEFFRNWNNRELFRLLSDYSCYTIRMDLFANTYLKRSLFRRVKISLSKPLLSVVRNRFNAVRFTLYKKYYHVRFDQEYLSSSAIVPRTRSINHPDYEKYKFMPHERIVMGNYIVFCDIFFPLHPDFAYFYRLHLSDGKHYQSVMCRFFDTLEEKYKMPVIIAAHPKADYKGYEFGGRKIIKYHTVDLVYFSQGVVLHNCNSISFSILANKPILFISTDEYESVFGGNIFEGLKLLASTLGKEVYNIEWEIESDMELTQVDDELRERYIYSYLTSKETENKKNIDQLCNLLE